MQKSIFDSDNNEDEMRQMFIDSNWNVPKGMWTMPDKHPADEMKQPLAFQIVRLVSCKGCSKQYCRPIFDTEGQFLEFNHLVIQHL
jgi:hypothetical protein